MEGDWDERHKCGVSSKFRVPSSKFWGQRLAVEIEIAIEIEKIQNTLHLYTLSPTLNLYT